MNKGVEPTVSIIMVFRQVWYVGWGKLKRAQVQTRDHKDNIWLSLSTRKSNAKNPENSLIYTTHLLIYKHPTIWSNPTRSWLLFCFLY